MSVPLDSIRDAGTYICEWSGQLLRVPPSAVGPNGAMFNIVGKTPLLVTKISDDPALPVTRARRVVDELHITAGF